MSDFVGLAKAELGAGRVVPTGQLELRELKREDSIIVLFPQRTLDIESLSRFMRAGGRVLLLDDYGTGDALLAHFQMERIAAPRHPAEMLRNNPSFAIAEPASAHPVATDVTKVVTNHATGIRHPDLSPVLTIRSKDTGEDVLLAVAGAVGQGRLLAVGDPSIVMNSMLPFPGNRAFARGLVRYAADDDSWGRRTTGKIYIVTGSFEQKGSFGNDGLVGDDFQEKLRNVQDALAAIRKDGVPPTFAYILAVAAGLGVVVWVGSRAGRTHRPVPPRFTRAIPLVALGGVAGHAAVIGGPHTSRVLAMLELKAALEEGLCALLGLDKSPGHEGLFLQMSSRGLLDEEGLRVLKRILLRLSTLETMVLSQRAAPDVQGSARDRGRGFFAGLVAPASGMESIRDREVLATAKEIKKILQTARTKAEDAGDVQRNAGYAGGAT